MFSHASFALQQDAKSAEQITAKSSAFDGPILSTDFGVLTR